MSLITNILILLSLSLFNGFCQVCRDKGKDAEYIMGFFALNYRGKEILPLEVGAVSVEIEIHIQALSAFNDTSGEFEVDLFFSQMWLDPDLKFSNVPYNVCRENVTLEPEFLGQIWSPNVVLINAHDSYIHYSPTVNMFVILYRDGKVWVNYRLQVKLPCTVDLRRFPFDSQTCHIEFESFDYHKEEVSLHWYNKSVTVMQEIELPDFNIDKAVLATKTEIFDGHNQKDRLIATLNFKRRYMYYILQAYVPTYLTIFVSWIAFVMEPKATAARTSLSISALLALTFQLGNILSNLPRASYTKALDVWIMGCISFLFACIAELTFVSFCEKKRQEIQARDAANAAFFNTQLQKQQQHHQGAGTSRRGSVGVRRLDHPSRQRQGSESSLHLVKTRWRWWCENPETIDKFSLVFFPTMFLIFNLVYWFLYISMK